jgi:hypothetical protein
MEEAVAAGGDADNDDETGAVADAEAGADDDATVLPASFSASAVLLVVAILVSLAVVVVVVTAVAEFVTVRLSGKPSRNEGSDAAVADRAPFANVNGAASSAYMEDCTDENDDDEEDDEDEDRLGAEQSANRFMAADATTAAICGAANHARICRRMRTASAADVMVAFNAEDEDTDAEAEGDADANDREDGDSDAVIAASA